MAALLVISYDVSDPDRYAEYNPGSLDAIMGTVGKHGGQAVAAGPPDVVMGSMEHAVVCISFPDADAGSRRPFRHVTPFQRSSFKTCMRSWAASLTQRGFPQSMTSFTKPRLPRRLTWETQCRRTDVNPHCGSPYQRRPDPSVS